MRFFVYWPVALHPRPRRALLISYGVGVTARALTDTPGLEAIDVVDVSRDILELGRVVFPTDFPLDDPRVRVHVEDGRFFLLSGRGRYDVATGEPPPPKNAGISSLYTREYFRLLRARMAPGGVASYWLPVHQLRVEESRAVVRAFCDAFDDCSLWAGAGLEWVLAGSAGLSAGGGADDFAAQWRHAVVAPRLHEVGFEGPEWLASTFIADARFLDAWSGGTPALVDDFPLRISPRFADGIDPAYLELLRPDGRRRRFMESDFVARLLPPELRQRAAEAFDVQWTLDRIYARANGLAAPEEDALLQLVAGTRLRSPVLHAFLASEAEVAIARRASREGPAEPLVDELLCLDALADRDYARARAHLLRLPGPAADAPRAAGLRRLLARLPS
jgi:hypothetical protein